MVCLPESFLNILNDNSISLETLKAMASELNLKIKTASCVPKPEPDPASLIEYIPNFISDELYGDLQADVEDLMINCRSNSHITRK